MVKAAKMVHCVACGYPNSQGRATCYKCNVTLVYTEVDHKPFDQLRILSHAFTVFAVLVMIITIMVCSYLADTLQMLNGPAYNNVGPAVSVSKTVILTFIVGTIMSAYLYTIGRTMEWMSSVRENMNVIAFSLQSPVQQNVFQATDNVAEAVKTASTIND